MATDLTFITNENDESLLKRFQDLIKDVKFFDCLVGYFYSSGFNLFYKELVSTEKVRILIGIGTNKGIIETIQSSKQQNINQYSSVELKEQFNGEITQELENAPDKKDVEEGVRKFIEWIRKDKLEIRAYPSSNIHAKLYILTFAEGDRDVGRVITGSSNFTKAGFVDNLEFNVELKNRSDYEFAKKKFEELWEHGVDVSEEFVQTVYEKTWLNDSLTPYELFLKFLYEYFKEKINIDKEEMEKRYRPEGFLELEYQSEAVIDAKSKLEEYGGVFIADVVGLGKTYIATMLIQQLSGRTLVICPPALLDDNNPGSWPNAFLDFGIRSSRFESLGKLDSLIKQGTEKFDNVIIDEAHRFRTEGTMTYEKLAQICRGKRIILVSATPLNNTPRDILSQIKLFQKSRNSTLPNVRNLEKFFSNLEAPLKNLDRLENRDEYLQIVKDNAAEIREKILKYIMIRRTRSEVEKYFGDDLKNQKLRFPDVEEPTSVLYQLNDKENQIFDKTIELVTQQFKYSRYMPLTYLSKKLPENQLTPQRNMGRFMKILLVKRLESSFYAFRQSVDRFIYSYDMFINEFNRGNVYTSKGHISKIFDYIEEGNDEAIERLIQEEKAEQYDADMFSDDFIVDLKHDLNILKTIKSMWDGVKRDPKLNQFLDELHADKKLRENKIIIFTESKETAEYLQKGIEKSLSEKVLLFTGGSSSAFREKVIENFDAKAKHKKDEYRILLSTEVLSEGVNLHRSNIVINYDIPWNPTRLMQRVGRINRVDTKFKNIFTYNFFPTVQSNNQIKLREAAEAKIHSFIEMLGADAKLLTEGEEIKSHDLFRRLTSKKLLTGEDEEGDSELRYLQMIREIRDNDSVLFERVKRLPKKARSSREYDIKNNALLTYFRKGKLQKFYKCEKSGANEVDFFTAAEILNCRKNQKRMPIGKDFYDFLDKNKIVFDDATDETLYEPEMRGRDTATAVLKILNSRQMRDFKGFTEFDDEYLREARRLLRDGGLPKHTLKRLKKDLTDEIDPFKILGKLKKDIPSEFFEEMFAERFSHKRSSREVILSEYLVSEHG